MTETGGGLFQSASVPENYRQYLEPVIFAPWAERLIDYVGLEEGQAVLDVASGTGVVARAAARRVGTGGRVIASDISNAMLDHVAADRHSGGAEIETLECSATDIQLPTDSVEVVLCQQGLQFIPDTAAAVGEMRRVLRPGGKVGVAVWLKGEPLEPFETYGRTLQDEGVPEPFPNAYSSAALTMSSEVIEQAMAEHGFEDIAISTERLELSWDSAETAALGITGTIYGPAVAGLQVDERQDVMAELARRMSAADGTALRPVMTALFVRATAG